MGLSGEAGGRVTLDRFTLKGAIMVTKEDEGGVVYFIESCMPEGGGYPDDLKGLQPGVLRAYGANHSYVERYWSHSGGPGCMFFHNHDLHSDRDKALIAATEKASAIYEREGRKARTKLGEPKAPAKVYRDKIDYAVPMIIMSVVLLAYHLLIKLIQFIS